MSSPEMAIEVTGLLQIKAGRRRTSAVRAAPCVNSRRFENDPQIVGAKSATNGRERASERLYGPKGTNPVTPLPRTETVGNAFSTMPMTSTEVRHAKTRSCSRPTMPHGIHGLVGISALRPGRRRAGVLAGDRSRRLVESRKELLARDIEKGELAND